MSADNYIAIRRTTDGLFAVRMEFMSADYPLLIDSEIYAKQKIFFIDHDFARNYAELWDDEEYFEYGIQDFTEDDEERFDPLDIPYNEYDYEDNDWGFGGDYDDHTYCCDIAHNDGFHQEELCLNGMEKHFC